MLRGVPAFGMSSRTSRAIGMVVRVKTLHSLVAIVDDDESVRESLPDLLRHLGFDAQTFSSAEGYVESGAVGETDCLLLDVGLPGMSGPDLHQELMCRGYSIPTIFITGRSDRSLGPRLVAQGAVACLFKPFSDTALLDALTVALGSGD
jgi:FixJ family two-component response regulator